MTAIDTAAEIDIIWNDEGLAVRMPLTEGVTPDWCDHYRALARGRNLPAAAEVHPGRSWIIVTLPPSRDEAEIRATMDAARDLVAEADSAGEPPPTAETEAALRAWWARQRS